MGRSSGMQKHPLVLLLLLAACAGTPRSGVAPRPAPTGQSVLLVSLDGFRWDYLDRGLTPSMTRLAERGVRAQWMTPSFPSKTFPNHYTIVTGLYPEHHGIVANNMYDSVLGRFRLADTMAQSESRWWGGEPIWRTLQRQGGRAAPFSWPGSEAAIGGAHPWKWRRFDNAFPKAARVDSVLSWLSLPRGEAPTFVTLYYSDMDDAGHNFGPDSPEVDAALGVVDSMIGLLVDGLIARGLSDHVNLIIVSDHGMIETPANQVIALDNYINLDDVDVVDWTPVGAVSPKPGKEEAVYRALVNAHPHLKVYRKGEVPARFHFDSNPRITPLILVADPGWSIATKVRAATWKGGASHGWDPDARGMGALFIAAGPAFRQGVTVAPFQNIHVYELLAHILGIVPAPNDGTLDSVRTVLRGAAEPGVSPDRMRSHLVTLSSDFFEGRAPGTRGDTLATRYVMAAMKKAGLTAGAVGGTWAQPVAMVGVTPGGTVERWVDAPTRSTFGPHEILMATAGPDGPRSLKEGDLIFVGHGIVTEDGKWDDYKNVDVRGKVVVILQGTPSGPAWSSSGARLTQGLKSRVAMERGAWAVVTLSSEANWNGARDSYTRELPLLDTAPDATTLLTLLVHPDAAVRMLGTWAPLAQIRADAALPTFRPRPLTGKITIEYTPRRRAFTTPNVLGLLEGSDPRLKDEVVLVTAHWDHLGRDMTLAGDQIFNGALDNAIGVSQMLEMARVLATGPRPKRSVLFIATTAEEAGLFGAEWYVQHPRFPLAKTVGAINLDFGTPWGRTRDVITLGDGLSSLDSLFLVAAATQGRRRALDPYPEQEFWERSDHVVFARVGIPAMFGAAGFDYIGRPAGWGKSQADAYLLSHYHRPSDEVQGDWDLRGAAEDADAMVQVVRQVANAAVRPTWNDLPKTAPYRAAQLRLRGTP